ncbi:hypothetical protein [uncultured Mediterranean phage uvMED]|nr:hypothetical protein [uncultured Mediterranean phage uvMED]BAR16507.1 hypothetical protein [uncultured Mediterranean phage uvMED]
MKENDQLNIIKIIDERMIADIFNIEKQLPEEWLKKQMMPDVRCELSYNKGRQDALNTFYMQTLIKIKNRLEKEFADTLEDMHMEFKYDE